MELLLKFGADTGIKSNFDKAAVCIAKDFGFNGIHNTLIHKMNANLTPKTNDNSSNILANGPIE